MKPLPRRRPAVIGLIVAAALAAGTPPAPEGRWSSGEAQAMAEEFALLRFRPTAEAGRARVRIHADRVSPHRVSPYLTAKFCEHLGSNIYNGMEAQVLMNPTFAAFPFGGAGRLPDGGTRLVSDEEQIAEQIRARAKRVGWPDPELLVQSRQDSLAHWWVREGLRDAVRPSPDIGPFGGRAQRVQVSQAGQGVAQWTWLPLHRVRRYEWRVVARSTDISSLAIGLTRQGGALPDAEVVLEGISAEWRTFRGELALPADAPADVMHRLTLKAPAAGQFVVARALLYPADHIGGADPDVVRLLRDSRLPLLRWPGGNFVSGYRWEDGVGPVDSRPTLPNPAWGGVEPNLFGTDEFVAFCRAVGCEPMICINAGAGAPEEAARWVEYCNGPANSPQGARRAANGHPDPYGVRYWEVGNELYGRHQIGWTTAAGYADRYRRFVENMRAADPSILFIACGAACLCTWRGEDWNGRLLGEHAALVRSISDHVLVGGGVDRAADPLDVYRDFMAFPEAHEKCYERLRDQMTAAGVKEPRLAITEMQLFGRLQPPEQGKAERVTPSTFITPATMAEAVYNTLFRHMAVRLAPFVEMITHSATVNHGGGLRKERERVYANPCHHARAMFADFSNARPVAVEVESPADTVPGVLENVRRIGLAGQAVSVLDVLAAISDEGVLLLSLVNRGASGPVRVTVDLGGFPARGPARVTTLSAEAPWSANTLDAPEAVRPVESTVETREGSLVLDVPPFGVVKAAVPGTKPGRR